MPSTPPAEFPDEGRVPLLAPADGHHHFDQLVASVEDYAIFTLDEKGFIQNWNQGAQRIKQYAPAEIIGLHFSRFYTDEDRATRLPERELEIAAAEGCFSDEGWRLRKDGTQFWASVTLTALRSENGGVKGFLKITRDLTEHKIALEELRQSEERFRLLIESVQDYAIFMLDPEGHVMSWNLGARRIKGYEDAEIVGRHFSIFYPPEALAAHTPDILLRRALSEGRVEHEGWRVRKDGTRFWGNVILTQLHDESGELRGFAKITRDLTDRRNVEVLEETGKRKDVFLATLAHELRNPLAPMLPGIEVILKSPDNAPMVTKVAAMLYRQVDQMAHLIDDLLEMSRITTGKIVLKKVRVPLASVIERAVEAVNPAILGFRHTFNLSLPNGTVEIEVDEHRIAQVISNLLSNAAKYTPPGGRIDLSVALDPSATLRISVRDNGRGIALPLQHSIFDLFDQGASGSDGLGIGLTLVKNLMRLHGGSVTVTSEGQDKGSEFTVILPGVVRIQEVPVASDAPASHEGRTRVLVADDGKNAADILAMFFEMEGLEACVAYDGVEAVEKAKEFMPDLVCMDLGMPRMDGFEAARHIRSMKRDVILVALSGWGAEDDRRRTAEAGFNMHLVKPVKPEDLRAVLAKMIGG